MSFQRPEFLWLTPAALALIAWSFLRYARRRRHLGDLFGGPDASWRLTGVNLYRFPSGRALPIAAAAVALALAIAAPRNAPLGTVAPGEPWDVVLAVDVSRSMQATDVAPSRIAGAREVLLELIGALPAHRLGLLLFASAPYPVSVPTLDHDVLRFFVEGIDPQLVSENDEGTGIAAALAGTVEMFAAQPEPTGGRAVVLLSDGDSPEESDAGVTRAARELAGRGVRLFTIGIGTAQGVGLTRPHRPGRWGGPILREDGAPVVSRLNETLLREIADRGSGRYANAAAEGGVQAQFRALAALKDSGAGQGGGFSAVGSEFWFALAAVGLLLAESLGRLRAPVRPPRRPLRRV